MGRSTRSSLIAPVKKVPLLVLLALPIVRGTDRVPCVKIAIPINSATAIRMGFTRIVRKAKTSIPLRAERHSPRKVHYVMRYDTLALSPPLRVAGGVIRMCTRHNLRLQNQHCK